MTFIITTATRKIAKLSKRIRIIQGGTGASKTISILIYLISVAQSDEAPTLTSVVSESLPHLKRGAMRDFKNIMMSHRYWRDDRWNATDRVYIFETGSKIEFFPADQSDKLRGARRDRLFVNEANNISLDAFNQLEVRTKEFVFIDFNPTSEFWAFTHLIGAREDVDHLTVTYKDNEALDKAIVETIERRRIHAGWWRVYGEGQLGVPENRIYTNWRTIEKVPEEARLELYGLDFGYTNDPTAIVAVYKYNDEWIIDEITYQTGLSNRQIADIFLRNPRATIIADSAEPKSIDELRGYGLIVLSAVKGSGSIKYGIQYVQSHNIAVTNQSVNILKEYRNYLWITDRNGKILNEPQDWDNHAMDAMRYAIASRMPSPTTPSVLDEIMSQRGVDKRTGYLR